MGSIAQSQGTVDMSKMTCEDLLKGSGDSIQAAIWLSGYHNGLRKNTKLDLGQFKKNADAVVAECKANPEGDGDADREQEDVQEEVATLHLEHRTYRL